MPNQCPSVAFGGIHLCCMLTCILGKHLDVYMHWDELFNDEPLGLGLKPAKGASFLEVEEG